MKKINYALVVLGFVSSAVAQDSTTTTTTPVQQQTTTYTDDNSHRTPGADDRKVQLGGDFVVPYRVDSPNGRTASLIGAHTELFLVPAWAISLEGLFGIETNGFADKPIFISPGMTFYGAPGSTLEPFLRADVPILINNDQDLGVRGGLGFMWNLGLAGLGLRYSFDATYFFDSEATSLNLAHVSAVLNW
jgi:hypothetical protein